MLKMLELSRLVIHVSGLKSSRSVAKGVLSVLLTSLPTLALGDTAYEQSRQNDGYQRNPYLTEAAEEMPSNEPWEASQEEPILAKRFFIGASAGISRLDPVVEDTPYRVTDRTDAAFSLLTGFHITPKIMAQFSYSHAGSAELEHSVTNALEELEYHIWSADLQYYLWQHESGVALFGGGGATYIDNSADVEVDKKDDIQLKVKVGLDYAMTSDLWLRTQYESFSGDAQILSLGLLKYMGGTKEVTRIVTQACEITNICGEENPYGDDDLDGVANRYDLCPNTLPGLTVDVDGCALFNKTYTNVLFKFDSYTLTEAAVEILDEMAVELKKVPFVRVSIAAHTDSVGTIAYNDWLSVKRARAIIDYLVIRGINQDRLEGRGYGEREPVANNTSPEGRALNRRAEFKIIREVPTQPVENL